jgi:hypothetical protein
MEYPDAFTGPRIFPLIKHCTGFRVAVEQNLLADHAQASAFVGIVNRAALTDIHAIDTKQQSVRFSGAAAVGAASPAVDCRLTILQRTMDAAKSLYAFSARSGWHCGIYIR